MKILIAKEKGRLLRMLESGHTFRYALLGFLGFREILDKT